MYTERACDRTRPVLRVTGWELSRIMLGVELRLQLTCCRAATRAAASSHLLLRPTLSRLQTSLCRAMTLDTTSSGPFNWVAGARCNPVDNVGTSANISPRTGSVMCTIPSSGPKEVERAVAVARKAFPAWAALSGMERGRLLTRYSEFNQLFCILHYLPFLAPTGALIVMVC